MKELSLLFVLCLIVLALNASVISFNMIYQEQSLLYVANHSLHSWLDLFSVYLHPQMLHLKIPFFRPSGNFLLYQLFMPIFGWHNNQALIVINLLFLALTGYLMIKIYKLLFPGFKWGGYLAFSIYLMHPALILPRLMTLHFEFAYVFFVLWSLYCFIRCYPPVSCHSREGGNLQTHTSGDSRFRGNDTKQSYLAYSLILYVIAVTFKESALMLGPVLMTYFCIAESNRHSFRGLLVNKSNRQIIILLMIVTLSLALYLTLPWANLQHPLGAAINSETRLLGAKELLKTIFALRYGHNYTAYDLYNIFPPAARCILWILWPLTLLATVLMIRKKSVYRGSLLFLYLSSLLFLVMPVIWGMGFSWHMSLSLVFISLLMGVSVESLPPPSTKNVEDMASPPHALGGGVGGGRYKDAILILIALTIALSTPLVNLANIHYKMTQGGLAVTLRSNAVFHPPLLEKLNETSIIVVEDSLLRDPYLLGASTYPYPYPIPMFRKQSSDVTDWARFSKLQRGFFMKYDPTYNGSLFKWAYLLPELREEEYPFRIEHMEAVPDEALYNWLRNYDNIFCLGYDQKGNWYDRSDLFKRNLLRETAKRKLAVYRYDSLPMTALKGNVASHKVLPVPDYQNCQLDCDQDQECRGFVYEHVEYGGHPGIKCHFYDYLMQNQDQFCATCIGFIKQAKLG